MRPGHRTLGAGTALSDWHCASGRGFMPGVFPLRAAVRLNVARVPSSASAWRAVCNMRRT